jgi:hypothetical protein
VQLVITLTDAGQCQVSGPIDNKLICFGALEMAKEAIQEYHKHKKNGIVAASAADAARLHASQ